MNSRAFSQPSEEQYPSSRSHMMQQRCLPTPQIDSHMNSYGIKVLEFKVPMNDGSIISRTFSLGKKLGKGAFAECYECTDLETRENLAVKVVNKANLTKERAKQKMLSEIRIHRSLDDPHIVKFHHVFEDASNVYIMLELCKNQTLSELLKRRKRLHELEVQCYVQQIIEGLLYLHSEKVIHRDLKLGNVFLNSQMEIKLGDFGLAARLQSDGEKRTTICGTPNYIAPEVLNSKTGHCHSFEVDIWALGIIMFTLITGRAPFDSPDVKLTYKNIVQNNYAFPEDVPMSIPAKDLIVKILNPDPTKRPTLLEILQHPFLNHGGKIPKTLPISNLVCAPSPSFLNQYAPQQMQNWKAPIVNNKFRETAAIGPGISKYFNQASPVGYESMGMTPKASTAEIRNLNFDLEKENSEMAYSTEYGGVHTPTRNNFNNSNNPNNQAMIASGRNFRMDLLNQFSPQDSAKHSKSSDSSSVRSSTVRDSIYILKAIDRSDKYGLGYILSNGSCGFVFNDSTKMILEPRGSRFEYIEDDGHGNVQIMKFTLEDFPESLSKKVTLLKYIQENLLKYLANQKINFELDEESEHMGMVIVKKWFKNENATLYRLSNKVVQVTFADKTELILNSSLKMVKYRNKKGERTEYPLESIASGGDKEAVRRLKYARQMLSTMLEHNERGIQQENNQDYNQNAFMHPEKDLMARLEVPESS